jgi:capsular polysaccharide biosynthesis protein
MNTPISTYVLEPRYWYWSAIEFYRVVRSRWILIVTITFVVTAFSAAISYSLFPVYAATSKIKIAEYADMIQSQFSIDRFSFER